MTFANLDELVEFFEQFAEDRQREFETGILLRADDISDDIGDTIDGCREFHEEAMAEWRVNFRRELEALPFRFPLRVTLTGFDQRKRIFANAAQNSR